VVRGGPGDVGAVEDLKLAIKWPEFRRVGSGSRALKAEVKAFWSENFVRGANSGYCGLNYLTINRPQDSSMHRGVDSGGAFSPLIYGVFALSSPCLLDLLRLIECRVEPLLFVREELHYLHRYIQEFDRVFFGPGSAAQSPPGGFPFFHRFWIVLSCHF
jgi:hypothetical protein